MMPLADRVLLAVQASPASVRSLARELGADVRAVQGIVRGLEAQGAVEELVQPGGSTWRLAPGVCITFRPPVLVVEGATPLTPLPPPEKRCRVVTSRGKPCRLKAVDEGRCLLHQLR